MIPSLTQLKTCSSIRRCRRRRLPCRRRYGALLGCFYAGWLSIRNRGGGEALHRPDALPRSLAACRKSKSGYLATRPSARTHARPPPGLEPGGRSTRGSPFAKMGAGAARRRSGRTDAALLFSPPLRTHAGRPQGRGGGQGKGKQCEERASELSTMLGAVLSALGCVNIPVSEEVNINTWKGM